MLLYSKIKMKNPLSLLLISLLLLTTLVLITGAGCDTFLNPLGRADGSEFTIEVRDFVFKPEQLIIKTGDTVTWMNVGSVVHTATSDNGTEIASLEINPGASYSKKFTLPGTYTYHCTFYSFMRGTIIVQ